MSHMGRAPALPQEDDFPVGGVGANAPIGISPRNKKQPVWPPISPADLCGGPIVQIRRTRLDIVTMSLSELRPTHLRNAYPSREPRNFKGRKPTSGSYWSSTMQDLVWYESRLERETILLADFDPDVIYIVSQPVRLAAIVDGQRRIHTPDYGLMRSRVNFEIVNCKPLEKVNDPETLELHGWVERAFNQVGVPHRVASELPSAMAANLAVLAHMRRPGATQGLPLDEVAAQCSEPISVGDLIRTLAPTWPQPVVVLCVRALLWFRVVETDLTVVLSARSVLRMPHV